MNVSNRWKRSGPQLRNQPTVAPTRMRNKYTKAKTQKHSLTEINCKCSTERENSSPENAWDLGKEQCNCFCKSSGNTMEGGAGRVIRHGQKSCQRMELKVRPHLVPQPCGQTPGQF